MLLVLVCAGMLAAQVSIPDSSALNFPIKEILITGNEITQNEIILREMKIKPGMLVTETVLERDRLRVQGLNLFGRVEFLLSREDISSILTIKVTEEWYIFPLPYWQLTDQKPPKLIYGFRYLQKNFRGRAESFSGSLWGGENHGFAFSHVNPWMKGTPALSRSINVYQITQASRNLAVHDQGLEHRQTVAEATVGKRWTLEFSGQVGVRFRLIQADNSQQLATSGAVDQILEANFGVIWDGRDLWQFPRRGFYGLSRFSHGWILNSDHQFSRLIEDFRVYVPYRRTSLCARLAWQPGWGEIAPYDWYIVEDSTPIRSFRLCDEGKSLVLTSLETRIVLFPLHYFTWQDAPYFKQYFTNLRYGLAAEVFVDAGDVYNKGTEITSSSLMWGYGGGLILRLPYVDVIRLECSWNPKYSFADVLFTWKVGISF
ncbi:MAG: BamA/TamA family outer membrane protein [bacterium]|nr:BamA/TamA family outer membrane protein [bacterium]